MKKLLRTILLIISIIIIIPLTVYAQDDGSLLMSGYTTDGIFYEVFGEELTLNARGNISVDRQIVYNGKVTPPATLVWVEEISGVTYSGTLKLKFYTYSVEENKTTACYTGVLANE